jgi:opacity protein-like surface antigen
MSNRASIFCSFALTAAAAVGVAAPANAADLGSFFGGQQQEQDADVPTQPVEFGTGWYIRGSVGGAVQAMPDLLSDPNNIGFTQKLNWFVETGGGYQFNQWFRTDASYTYYGSQSVKGNGAQVNCPSSFRGLYDNDLVNGAITQVPIGVVADANMCTPRENASVQKNLFLANGYVDLGTYWGVTPYIGGGVGAAYMNATQSVAFFNDNDGSPYRATLTLPNGYPSVFYSPNGLLQTNPLNPQPHYNYGPQNWDYSQSTWKWNFAFALMAGFSYDISQNLKLDLGYRYVNFGTMSFKSLLGSEFDKSLSSQEVRLGLRYIVD